MDYKVMKRPMFKMGGKAASQGTGITSGLDERVNYSKGAFGTDRTIDELKGMDLRDLIALQTAGYDKSMQGLSELRTAISKYSSTKNSQNYKSENIIKSVGIEANEMSAKANERNPNTELVLKAIGNSWVEIEDLNGNILMTRLMRPGETYIVPNIKGLTFNTGNAGALSLSRGDIFLPSLGDVGEIIKARPLNIKAFTN